MPKITDERVIGILQHPYFDHHTMMHLARERLVLPNGTRAKLFLPGPYCAECDQMIEAGEPGSGKEFLDMHHEMLRVFKFLLGPSSPGYAPQIWNLDFFNQLPHEIVGMFNVTDPHYLHDVFEGVSRRTGYGQPKIKISDEEFDDRVDSLGCFIERGIDQEAHPDQEPDGSGFHNTIHEYLAAREGKAAQGAEMNKLRNSMFNDYFWSLHLWIDGQYGRLTEHCGRKFETSGLDPKKLDMFEHNHGMSHGMMSM